MRVIGEFFLAFQFWCNIMQGQPGKAWVGGGGVRDPVGSSGKNGMKDGYETGVYN